MGLIGDTLDIIRNISNPIIIFANKPILNFFPQCGQTIADLSILPLHDGQGIRLDIKKQIEFKLKILKGNS